MFAKLAGAFFPDPDLRLALSMAEKLSKAREESKPLILFVDHSGQVSILIPFRVYGNFLFFEFGGEKYVTYYDASKTYRLKGQPIVHVLENQLYPVELRDAAVLSYFEQLKQMLYKLLEEQAKQMEEEHPEYLKEIEEYSKARQRQGQEGQEDPDPVSPNNPLLQIYAVQQLLRSSDPLNALKGVEYAFAALGIEPAFPIDIRVITKYVPTRETLKELLTYFERWAYAHFAALSGLQQFYGKKLDMNKLLQILLLIGLFLFGAYLFASFVLPGLMHSVPSAPTGVKVP
jgi:TM2 domain-containing membrane protein YozV